MRIGENIRLRKDGRYEARYIKYRDDNGKVVWGYCYGDTYEEAYQKKNVALGELLTIRENNLLILGAGDHGNEVREIAEALRVFTRIDYLDDDYKKENIIGGISDASKFVSNYPLAIPAVGNKELRIQWMIELVKLGFVIPTLIHPSASISHTAIIQPGTVICAGATIGLNAHIGKGCIIDSGAVINKNVTIPDWTLVECGEIVSNN